MIPKISVCVPVYKTEKFLTRCLDSISTQSFRDIEIIVVNDASPDNSLKILNLYSENDDRIVIVNKTENEGLMCARRDAYKLAKGEYVMFVDSDDYLETGALEKLYKLISEEDADIAVSGYNYYPVVGASTTHIYQLPFGEKRDDVFQALFAKILPHNLWANIYKRQLFEDYEYICIKNQTNAEDLMLFYELVANCNKVVALGEATYAYCQNIESATQNKLSDEKIIQLINLEIIWFKRMQEVGIAEELLETRIMSAILSLYLSDYSPKVINPLLGPIDDRLGVCNTIKKIGFQKAILFQTFLRHQRISKLILSTNKIIKKITRK